MQDRVVLDTNCLIMALSKNSESYPAWKKLREGKYTLCVSNEILTEYREVISSHLSAEIADNVIGALCESPFVEFIVPYYHLQLIEQDPDDNKFVDCAFAASAKYIVSNDRHFDVLKQIDFPKIQVIRLIDFIGMLNSL